MSARRRFEALTPPVLHRFNGVDEDGPDSLRGRPNDYNPPMAQLLQEVDETRHGEDLTDLSSQAVWTVSSAKPGNGVEKLLDGQEHTFWQSDGMQPHTVSLQFVRKVKLKEVRVFLNYPADESYTPSRLEVKVGSYFHDLRSVGPVKELVEPVGWTVIPLCGEEDGQADNNDDDEGGIEQKKERVERMKRQEYRKWLRDLGGTRDKATGRDFIRTHMLQLIIHSNHQNGRDSHIRQIEVLGPIQQSVGTTSRFSSIQFQMHETIR
eukprot:Plantae.Rhodophyta-Hildenbrandia_rubra.ctg8986.p2 GENE.Plantae.Rhodophyta-Hildenbrandia_rubra.ctg8986~~Plantae.Rhodophyta-Hildenbrandia_rubra.ctg8986.p2  ORF type:complete len:265 (+),score=41.40 Plantae.Rhodophyta-Hildenbrandia_rubra.ctg8986:907-1701(+)